MPKIFNLQVGEKMIPTSSLTYDDFADDLELGNCYDCCCHHDCVDCDMDDEEYVNVTLPKEDIETLHMLCRIFKV